LNALTVHAGLLDEAFVALSSEPLVYGALLPAAQSLWQPNLYFGLPPLRAGEPNDLSLSVSRTLWWVVQAPLRLLQFAFNAVFGGLLSLWSSNVLLKIINSAAYGLPAREFAGARLHVRPTIDEPDLIREEVFDAGQLLIAQPPAAEAHSNGPSATARRLEISDRFSFLWDTAKTQRRLDASELWKKIKPVVPRILQRYPAEDVAAHERELKITTLAIEERAKEITGLVELNHSLYHSNQVVIARIASFLRRHVG